MPFELQENSGSLFPNRDRKEDKHPNARGEAKIDGIVYEVRFWKSLRSNSKG